MIFEYFVPIENSAELDGDFIINGIAINETTTSNGHKFLGEELKSAASSLIGVPLLKDHDNSVDSIVGKVTVASFNEVMKNIPFRAVVKDPKIKELIKDKLLNTVSVGAHVDPSDIEELENGDIVPHNITFKELSVVAVPADNGATFQVALNNAHKGLHSINENSNSDERGNETMTKKEIKEEESPEAEEATEEKEVKEEPVVTEEKVKSWVVDAIKSMKESDVDEEKPEETKEETKEAEDEEDESEEVEEKGDYEFKQSHNVFSMERKSYNYN